MDKFFELELMYAYHKFLHQSLDVDNKDKEPLFEKIFSEIGLSPLVIRVLSLGTEWYNDIADAVYEYFNVEVETHNHWCWKIKYLGQEKLYHYSEQRSFHAELNDIIESEYSLQLYRLRNDND